MNKHTGYTPGPWRYTSDGRVFGCCAHEWNASLNMETAPFVAAGTRKQADLDLIADAPRLAEENERLRSVLKDLMIETSQHVPDDIRCERLRVVCEQARAALEKIQDMSHGNIEIERIAAAALSGREEGK